MSIVVAAVMRSDRAEVDFMVTFQAIGLFIIGHVSVNIGFGVFGHVSVNLGFFIIGHMSVNIGFGVLWSRVRQSDSLCLATSFWRVV